MIGFVLGAFGLAVVLTPVMAALARRLHIVDLPGPLKVHLRPVPYLGGAALFPGFAIGALAVHRPLLVLPLALALALGLVDDVYGVAPAVRLVSEVGIGMVLAVAIPNRVASPWGFVATVAVVVVLINAVNLIDGLDGLAAGVGLAAAVGFAVLLPSASGRSLATAVAGALAGFLLFNRPPARIYLGDSGSYLLGTALALLLATAWRPETSLAAAVGALALVAVPVTDTALAIIRRLRARRPIFEGDRGHAYDRLVDRGMSPGKAAATCVGAQSVIAAVAVVARSELEIEIAVVVTSSVILVALILAVGFAAPDYRRHA